MSTGMRPFSSQKNYSLCSSICVRYIMYQLYSRMLVNNEKGVGSIGPLSTREGKAFHFVVLEGEVRLFQCEASS